MPSTQSTGLSGGSRHFTGEKQPPKRRKGAKRTALPPILTRGQVADKSEAAARRIAARRVVANAELAERDHQANLRRGEADDAGWVDIDMDDVMETLGAEQDARDREQDEEGRVLVEELMANFQRKDTRDRSDRVQRTINAFRRLREPMTTAFLDWRADPVTCNSPWAQPWTSPDWDAHQHISVHVFDIYGTQQMNIPIKSGQSQAACLVRMGLFPCTVQVIKTVITVRTLELYRNLFLRCPKVGIQAFCLALFDLHFIPRNHNFDALFRTALDAYLDILANADQRAAAALGRDTPHWRIKNSCPPCQYPLEGEAPLEPGMEVTLDGNNSAKRLDVGSRQTRDDDRKAPGDFYLPRDAVDIWAKENIELLKLQYNRELESSTYAPGAEPHCPDERWKNMQEKLTALAQQAYDETGIMPCLCRHNFVLLLVDMVHSGEMFKYGFAIVNHLVRTLDRSLVFGYDIGCSFGRAVRQHPVLGPLTRRQRTSFLVGAFHGTGHSRICQCKNLPRYRIGVGMEYFEGLEAWFSKSNNLASITRTASRFHRQQAIVQYVQHANAKDAYGGLAKLLVAKYQNALSIKAQEPRLVETLHSLGIDRSVLGTWVEAEYEFLAGLQIEPPVETTQMEYYHALCTLASTQANWDRVRTDTPDTIIEQGDYGESVSITQRLETRRHQAKEKNNRALDDVQRLERALGVEERWLTDSQAYKDAAQLVKRRDYHRAIDDLESAVVAQAFESERLFVPGTNNRLRGQISKALQRRHQAIQNRFRTFNKCALALSLSTLSEENLANENFVAELALLRPSRINIGDQPWSKPGSPARQAMDLDFKLKRADEEINRLNIEIRRFWTWMEDESSFLRRYEEHLRSHGDPSLAFHIRLQRLARERFDAEHRRQLRKLVARGQLDAAVLQHGTSVDRSRHEAPVSRAIAIVEQEQPAEQDVDVSMSDEEYVDDEEDIGEEAMADGIVAVVAAASLQRNE
uniref:CxC1-like cysteine cluster associated with KDZ transposases domain-containing protein n=1 Tax=Mycena chlorophos TaxID=658473 RepID=A0ABQ0KYQ3_MYCCL|nr:predicted protein [Mycena chlorophos]